MTVYVYTWPPALGIKDSRWSVVDPVQKSRSPLTGKPYVSAHGRRRRVVDFEVSVRKSHGYGTMEGLIAALDGGVNKVRIYWASPTDVTGARGTGTVWGTGYSWSAGYSWDSDVVIGTPAAGGTPPSIALKRLVPSKTVARAGEFIEHEGEIRRLIADVVSTVSGTATAYLDDAFTSGTEAVVEIGVRQTGIFEVLDIPDVVWTFDRESTVTWRFREVFADEIGTHAELAPWGT